MAEEYTLRGLTNQEILIIAAGLRKGPFEEVAPLLQKLQVQIAAQETVWNDIKNREAAAAISDAEPGPKNRHSRRAAKARKTPKGS